MAWETVKLFLRATWKYKWLIICSEIGAILFILSVEILPPMVISRIVDKISVAQQNHLVFSDFTRYIWMFVGLEVVYVLSGRLMMQPYIRLEPRVTRDLENMSFAKLQGHSQAFFADNFSGALVAKVTRLTSSYQRFIETLLGDFFMLIFNYSLTLVVIAFLNPLIAAVFIVWTILFCISLFFLHRWKLRFSKAAAATQTKVTARLADIITNILTIRSFARSKEEAGRFHDLTEERYQSRLSSSIVAEWIRMYKNVVIVVLEVTVLVLSIHFAIQGILSLGAIVLIQFYLFKLIGRLWDFGRYIDRIEEALADASEMTEILLKPYEVVDVEYPETSLIHTGSIEFKNVKFQYRESHLHQFLFDNFNLTIPAGQKVGLVGPSGSGKTTLTKLLLRFMDINNGEILIDGQNISRVAQEDVRSSIAYVPQEPLLFHRTIRENIAYGKPRASEEQIVDIAKKAKADEFIQLLPKKYETMVGERGVKLSGGQRQRVALARAMLKDAPVLILDEATSSLDSVSEKLITEALDQLMEKRTTIVVAHRLSTIRKLDRILVLDNGEIKEDGTHEELLKKGGLYAELWSHQSGDFLTE